MLNFKNLFYPPESKSSRTAQVLAFASGGRARWTPRDYAALAREGYLANAVVHRAVRMIAENAASCIYLLYEGARELEVHPLLELLARPNPRQDGASLFETLYAHMLLSGNAYIEGVALDGDVRELYVLRPDRMKLVPGTDGWAEAYEYSVGGRSVRFDQVAQRMPPILHLTFFHPLDDHYGLAPLEAAAVAVDDAIQIAVRDTALTVPPSSPVDGERHIVARDATGAWTGQDNAVATWETNAWRFLAPKAGWCVWSIAADALLVFDGSGWIPVTAAGGAPLSPDEVPHLGINTPAIETNLLTVRSGDVLFHAIDADDDGTGDMRLQLSKEAAENTASVVFSDAFSGRAEFGLTGDDDFHLKVSADGMTWRDALAFDSATGRVSFPSGGAREMLTADRIYYVRTNGHDSNDGLSNTSGGAFLTIQKAIDVTAALDISIYSVTIQVASGTYTGAVLVNGPFVGSGDVSLIGDTATPSNVLISTTATACITVQKGGSLSIGGLKLKTTTSGDAIDIASNGTVTIVGAIEFGPAASGSVHISASNGGKLLNLGGGNVTVSGGGYAHIYAQQLGGVVYAGITVKVTGTPTFSNSFAGANNMGFFRSAGVTYSGSAIGPRWFAAANSVIQTDGAGPNTLPGNSNGAAMSGGQGL